MLQLATKNKANIERALQDFLSLASMDQTGRDNVGAILGMSIAYQLLKQTPRARNQLKRVFKRGWNFDDAEHLERCWLLLADIYIQVILKNTTVFKYIVIIDVFLCEFLKCIFLEWKI